MRNKTATTVAGKSRIRGFLANLLLILLSIWAALAVISHAPYDYRIPGDGLIYPPPRPIDNIGGPAGAMVAGYLIASFGYSALVVPLLLAILGIARILSVKRRSIRRIFWGIVAGHAILAALLALPGGELSIALTGSYGKTLASALESVFGVVGAYVVSIIMLLSFIVLATGLDIAGSANSAGAGIKSLFGWFSARKRRRKSRKTTSREELFAEYNRRYQAADKPDGITGSIIPGEAQTDPSDTEITEPIENGSGADKSHRAVMMEYIPPQIKRREPDTDKKTANTNSQISSPPPAKTIDPEALRMEKAVEREPVQPDTNEMPPPKIGHEPPLPEPVPLEPETKRPISYDSQKTNRRTPTRPPRGTYKYTPPPLDILIEDKPYKTEASDEALRVQSKRLLETLRSFDVEGEIREICPGPVITRFELEPAVGVKVSRISNLADDIALALKAQDIRIVAPIPGKGAVGIEVPNVDIQTVRVRSVLSSDDFKKSNYMLPMALGQRVDGTPAVVDLARMPHLLIAGATGSGKSVCINSILTSLVYSQRPTDTRFILIDPKRLELSVYSGIAHLAAPVVVEPKHAALALNWAIEEMEARYRKLSDVGVRSIVDYNAYVKRGDTHSDLKELPYIVVIIDELADLMATVSSEIEEPVARLAQMARAVGIHLIIATQRPSVDVVTGLIKANFPSRIAFKVRSKIDSRTILDMGGAERLLGRGDMLYLPSGCAEPVRIHGSLITTEETERIVRYLKTFPNPYPDEIIDFDRREETILSGGEKDELFWEAAKIVVMYKQGSTSFLQRKLRVGYTRAGCIIDQLEQEGIVGGFQGSKARDVLIDSLDELDSLKTKQGF